MEARIDSRPVARLALHSDAQGVVQKLKRALLRLSGVPLLQRLRQVEQGLQPRSLAHNQVPQVRAQREHKVQGVESLGEYLVKCQHRPGVVLAQERVHESETVLVVQHVEVVHHVLVLDVRPAERHCLVEDGERVAHRAVRLSRYDVQGLVIDIHALLGRNLPQVADYVRNGNPVEVVCLAAGEDGRDDLVLLGGGEDKHRMCRRLLQSLEERVERRLREHVHLVYDIDAVPAHLRGNLHLLQQRLDIVHAIVGGGVQLMYAVRAPLGERTAGLAQPARLYVGREIGAVDSLGKYAGGCRLADPPRAAEQVGVRYLAPLNGILEGAGYHFLPYEGRETLRPVLAG